MAVRTHQVKIQTDGQYAMHDMTEEVARAIAETGYNSGSATVFVAHTTAAIIIGELEPGLAFDIRTSLERIAPLNESYRHNELNADDNAHSHLTGSVIGPSEVVPFDAGRLLMGTWQRIVLLELDTRSRRRKVVIQIHGE